ncbi:MAG: N-acetylmuramoyl-L-alanine amidase family protein [bacterium]
MKSCAARVSALVCAAFVLAWVPRLCAAPLVLLDPGHGGSDTGVSVGNFHESDYVLALAKRMVPLLESRGLDVRLTRDGDEDLSVSARVALANTLQPSALISLHVNAAFQADAHGPRLFVPASSKPDLAEAPLWELAAGMHAEASRKLGLCLAKALGVGGPRPVQTLKLALFRGLSVPACLVEIEFATNADGLAELKNDAQAQAWAGRLAAGIADYVLASVPAKVPHAKP